MKNSKTGKRYAKAFLDLSLEQHFLEKAREDMQLILEVYEENRDLRLLLGNPVISPEKKESVFRALFGPSVHEGTLLFLVMLARKRRENFTGDIAESFLELYREHNNIRTVVLTTAVPAGDELRRKVTALVKEEFRCEVELSEVVDPKLIGGFSLKMDDFRFDTSIHHQLDRLRKQFRENVYKKGF